MASGVIPFLRYGYSYADISASYYQDYVSNSRKPFSGSLRFKNSKYFGYSMYYNFLSQIRAYLVDERGDILSGGDIFYQQGLPKEFFIQFGAKYSTSDTKKNINDRGIKIANTVTERFKEGDVSAIEMVSLKGSTYYVKSALKISTGIKKVFNYDKYFFTFPLSLRREALKLDYNYYKLDDFDNNTLYINEFSLGVALDTLLVNVINLPINLKYVYSDNDKIADKNSFKFTIDFDF
jgi:hypothetical protein